jgi:hypothetical protein
MAIKNYGGVLKVLTVVQRKRLEKEFYAIGYTPDCCTLRETGFISRVIFDRWADQSFLPNVNRTCGRERYPHG